MNKLLLPIRKSTGNLVVYFIFLRRSILLSTLLIITLVSHAQNCSVNAGVDFSICANSTLTLAGGKAGLFQGSGNINWTQVSGPSAVITDPSNLGTTVTSIVGGNNYKFRLSATCADGSLTYNEVTVQVRMITVANAGPDQSVCPGNAATNLSAGALNTGETGAWTVQGTNNGITVVSSTSPTSAINVNQANSGNTTLRWTITNGTCTSYDDVVITNRGGQSAVTAGADRVLNNCYATTQSTNPSGASLGGGGVAVGQTGLWTVVDGPNVPSIASPNSYNATFSNLIQGVYTFRWTVSGVCVNGSDIMQVTVPAPNGGITSATISSPPTTSTNTSNYCDGRTEIVLVGSVPGKPGETVSWTKSGNAGGTIDSPTSSTINVSGLVPGASYTNTNTYTYTISSTNGCPASSINRTITWTAPPTLSITSTSPLLLNCGTTSATVNYTSTGGSGSVQWMILSGPTTPTYPSIPTSWTNGGGTSATISGLTKPGTYQLRFQKLAGSGSGCSAVFQDFTVVVAQTPTASNAGTDQVLACNVFSTNLVGNVPTVGTGMWTQVSGPNTASLPSPYLNNSPISGLTSGKYTFRWLISSGNTCPNTQDDVSVIVSDPTPTASAAGLDLTICNSTPLILTGNEPKLNERGTWTVTPTSGVTFADIHAPNTTVTGMASNTTYTFTWTITNACGSSSDNVVITTSAVAGPIPSLAGPDQCLPSGTTTATLAGNLPGAGTGTWTQLTGTPATITNPLQNNSTVTDLSNGTSSFEWSITRNICTITRDTVVITISATTSTANAGTDQSVCGNQVTLSGNNPANGIGYWTQTGGPGGATITNPSLYNTTVTGLIAGAYTFRWNISNFACASSYDEVQINVSSSPSPAVAGADQSICAATSTTVTASPISDGTGLWTIVSGPNSPSIVNPTNISTTINGLTNGTYVVRWRTYNGPYCPSLYDDMILDVTTAVTNTSLGGNQTLCGANSATLTGNQSTIGTWTQDAGPNTATISSISSSAALATGLIPGVYTFRYTYTTPTSCSNTATITVTISAMPVPADAGPDLNVCDINSVTMAGNTPSAGTGAWSRVSGPNTPNIVSSSSPTTAIGTTTALTNGTYVYRWTITNGSCSTSDDMMINRSTSTTVANAGPDQPSVCGSTTTMAANTPAPGVGTWSQVSGPNTAVISSVILPNTTITGMVAGTYVFRWSITNGFCAPSTDDVSITTYDTPTTANAGPDQVLCGNSSVTLAGNAIIIGTGTWSQVSGPAAVITDINDPVSTVTGLISGTYIFQWKSQNGSCSTSDNVSVSISAAPTVSAAGPDQSVCLFAPINLTANTPVIGTGSWSQISGSTATIESPNSASTSITGVVSGTYGFRWTITNGTCPPSTDDVMITVNDLPSLALAGADISLCNVTSTTLSAVAATTGTGLWTLVNGPNTPVITNPALPGTTITGMITGTYVFDWTITNGPCTSSDQVQVTISAVPTTANAGSDQSLCGTSTVTLEGNAALVGTGTWTRVSGPNTPTITNLNAAGTTVTGLVSGTYVFRWTITNGACLSTSDDVQISVTTGTVTTSNAGPDQTGSSLCGLTTATLGGNVPVTGTGLWSIRSGTGGTLGNASSNTSTLSGTAGSTYVVRWTITNGTCSSFDDVTITFPINPTTSNAGADQTGISTCGLTTVTLAANTPLAGTGAWSIITGTGGTITTPGSPTSTFTGTAATAYVLRWTISNSPCTASTDDVGITFNQPPSVANAGPDQTGASTCGLTTVTLAANTPTTGTGTWSIISGTGGTVTSPSSPASTFSGTAGTAYVLRWTVSNAPCTASTDDVNITFNRIPTTANAGPDQTGPSTCGLTTVTLAANTPATGSGLWTIVSGTGGTITTPTNPASTFTGVAGRTYTLKWTISNSPCNSSEDLVSIELRALPSAPSGSAIQYLCTGDAPDMTDLTVTGNNIQWHDASTGGNLISSLTLLVNGTTYYASQTVNGCESSSRLSVQASVLSCVGPELNDVTVNIDENSPSGTFVFDESDVNTGTDLDADNDNIQYSITGGNSLGNFVINSSTGVIRVSTGATLDYETHPVFIITVRATDGINETHKNVTINLNNLNDNLPVAVADSYSINEGGILMVNSLTGVLSNDTDADGSPLNSILVSSTIHGTLVLNADGSFIYTNDGGEASSDTFRYKVNDGADGNTVTVTITITPVNDVPVAVADSYTVAEGGVLIINALTGVLSNDTDADGNTLSSILVSSVSHGTLNLNPDGSFTYRHDGSESTTDTFAYKVNDGTADGNTVTVTITITPVNDVPVVSDIGKTGDEDTVIRFSSTDFTDKYSDNEGNGLVKILIVSLPSRGTLKVSYTNVKVNDEILISDLGNLNFSPDANWSGNVSFRWNGFDGSDYASSPANVNITVNPVNDAPVLVNTYLDITLHENDPATGINISGNVSDPEGNTLTTSVTGPPSHGSASVTPQGNITYTPNRDYSGSDVISYQVCDNGVPSQCTTGTINITVIPAEALNHAPEISSFEKTTNQRKSFIFSRNDYISKYSDADNDTLFKIQVVTLPPSGKLRINGVELSSGDEIQWKDINKLEFIPDDEFYGETSFRWKASDGTEYSASADVVITVIQEELFIPEGFSPNGDGINDFFIIKGADAFNVTFQVYNRWGNLVYEKKSYKNDWDGIANSGLLLGSRLPDGTYFYIINFNNGEKAKVGYITINR
jgi:gliding motility-associated-like protein